MGRRKGKQRSSGKKKNAPLMSKIDLKNAVESIQMRQLKEDPPDVPISVTVITRDDPEGLRRCLLTTKRVLLKDGDEICVLDTGSTPENQEKNRKVVTELGGVFHYDRLVVDIRDKVETWLPEWLDTFEKSNLTEGSLLSFSEARDKCSKLAKHPVQFWIDTDDDLTEEVPGQLRWIVNRLFQPPGLNGRQVDSLFLEYAYAFDKNDGSCITTLKRERVVDTTKYKWVGRCHETLIPKDTDTPILGATYFQDLRAKLVHRKEFSAEDRTADIRNYVILRNEIEECEAAGIPVDIRTVFYMGNACRGLSRDEEALTYYNKLFATSGSLDDRYLAMYYCGMIWLNDKNRRPLDALECFFKCLKVRPSDPRSYFAISRCYYAMGRHAEAIQFFEQGAKMKPLEVNLHADDPQHQRLLPFQIAAMAARELNRTDYAMACAKVMKENYPEHPLTKGVVATVENDEAQRALLDGVMRLVANELGPDSKATHEEMKERIRAHMGRIPTYPPLFEKQGITALEPQREIDLDKEIVFFCGKTIEPFGPKSTGLGGSERMVCEMAPRLQAAGYQVSVFCECPKDQRGVDEETGVFWWHWGGLNLKREHGTFIIWRQPAALDMSVTARKKIVWCHDVQNESNWTPARCALVDQVWVLSEYHATTLGAARERLGNKVRITRNGVNLDLFRCKLDLFRGKDALKHDPKKIIFASSPDRGVYTAIKAFQRAKEKGLDGAKLHICYGFTPLYLKANVDMEYRHIPDIGKDANGWEYMEQVLHAADHDDDIIWEGRKTWQEMADLQLSAGVWLYPTRFPEISCLAAMEAQVAGCNIVCSDYAALAETVNWDNPGTYKVSPDDIDGCADALIKATWHQTYPARVNLRTVTRYGTIQAQNRFDLDALVPEWEALINS